MSAYVWVSATNPRLTYMTSTPNDPGAPAGYVLTNTSDGSWQGVNGVDDRNLQQYKGGLWSGGDPAYNGYTDGSASNGRLS